MAYTYQDARNLASAFTSLNLGDLSDLTATDSHFYWASQQRYVKRTDRSLANPNAMFLDLGVGPTAINITNDGTDLFISQAFGRQLPLILNYILSTGVGGTVLFRARSGNYIIAYNQDNDQLYTFPRQTEANTAVTYQRFSNTGTLLGTHTLTTPVIAATYDNVRSRFYLQGIDHIAAFSVGSDHTLTADTANDISSPTGFTIGRGIAYHNNTLYVYGRTTSFTQALGRFTAPAPIVDAAPTVTQTIPDQMLAATTTTDLNLPDYFDGQPAPTFSLGTGAPSFVTINQNTLTIAPQVSHVRAAVYPVTVIASNSEGTANDDFNITVSAAPPRAIASITGVANAAAETIAFTIAWTNVTDYAGFDATDITPTVSSGTRQASVLSARSNNSYVYTIYPTSDTNGTANITIAANVFTTPPAGGNNVLITSPTISYSFAPVPAGSKYKYTIPLPTNESGTLHVTMRERSVTADSVAGPGTQSYLGSFEYDTTVRPELVRIDRPNLLEVGNNDVILDWNVEVEGVAADQFYLEGIAGIDTTNITLFSTATPDPDTSPDASARTTPIAADTRAKYYLLRINIPDGTTITGNLDVYIVGGGINNDY